MSSTDLPTAIQVASNTNFLRSLDQRLRVIPLENMQQACAAHMIDGLPDCQRVKEQPLHAPGQHTRSPLDLLLEHATAPRSTGTHWAR